MSVNNVANALLDVGMINEWTVEKVYSLVADENARRISRRLASSDKWALLGSFTETIWGELHILKKPPIQTVVHLTNPTFICSCRSKRFPCDHAISMLLIWLESPESFDSSSPPDYAVISPDNIRPSDLTPIKTQAQDPAGRRTALVNGLEELELWLHDLIRSGLADLPQRPKTLWTQIAQRLVDAGAGEIAHDVLRIGAIPFNGTASPEHLLGEIGLLYLLIQGFKRLDTLPPEVQTDLQIAVGWVPRLDTSRSDLRLHDFWNVLSHERIYLGRQIIQFIWLWGQMHNRPALISQRVYNPAHIDIRFIGGMLIEAELCYFPGSIPVRAHIVEIHKWLEPGDAPKKCTSIEDAITDYSRAITINPWLHPFPFMLQGTKVSSTNRGWMISDASNSLPLVPDQTHLWHLQVLTRYADAPVFGEWNGEALRVLSIWVDNGWVELRTLLGTKTSR